MGDDFDSKISYCDRKKCQFDLKFSTITDEKTVLSHWNTNCYRNN